MSKVEIVYVPSEYSLGTTDGYDYTVVPLR